MFLDLVIELIVTLRSAQETAQLRRERAEPGLSSCAHGYLFRFQPQHAANHTGNALPVLRFDLELLPAAPGDGIELRLAVVLRRAPLCRDPSLLLQPQQRGVHRALVQLEHVAAHLLDAPRNAEPVQRSQRVQRLQDHRGPTSLAALPRSSCPSGFRSLLSGIDHAIVHMDGPNEHNVAPMQCP